MKLIRELADLSETERGGAVTIGNFDGVHRGHAILIERLIERARELGRPAVVFTFDPHPVRILRPEQTPPPLTWTERKADLLHALGVDVVIAYPTDHALLAMTPEQFFEEIILRTLDARALVEGPNFHFGKGRHGDVRLLEELCSKWEIGFDVVPPLTVDGEYISSSRIRECIARGAVAEARKFLTEPYRIRGMVTHGAHRGRTLGFPTANLEAIDTLLPAAGVYAGRAFVGGKVYSAATNIGPNPTFRETLPKVETHLLDYHGTLYGEPLEVDFIERLRDIRTFPAVQQLTEQLALDLQQTRQVVDQFIRESDSIGRRNGN